MNKSVIVHLVVIVISVVLGWYLADQLNTRQQELMPEMGNLNKAPIAGMHKFGADVEWMRFINYCGSQDSINKDNVDSVIKKLERLISLDPNFEKSYSVGVQMIAVEKPQKAIELLENACNNDYLKNNWKIPFYTAFIMNHHAKPPMVKESIPYYEKAVKRAGNPERFLVNAWIRARAKTALKEDEKFMAAGNKLVDEKHAILNELYKEWKKSGEGNEMDGQMFSTIPDLTERILETARKVKEKHGNDSAVAKNVKIVRDAVLKGRKLTSAYMTPAEQAVQAAKSPKGSLDFSKVQAQISQLEQAALKRIKEAEQAAISRIKKAAQEASK